MVVDSVYPEDDCEVMTICVCHRAGRRKRGEEIEVGFECLFESRFALWLDKLKKKRFAKKMKKRNYVRKNFKTTSLMSRKLTLAYRVLHGKTRY